MGAVGHFGSDLLPPVLAGPRIPFSRLSLSGRHFHVSVGNPVCLPAVLPGRYREEGILLGDAQSPITVFYLWHFAVVLGCLASALLLRSGNKKTEGLTSHGLAIGIAAAGLLAVASLLWVSLGEPYLFRLITDDGITSLAVIVDYALLAASAIALTVVSPFVLSGSFIQRWIVVVLVLAVGEAVVNVTVDRWSFGWYFNRGFGMMALGGLLVVLAWRIAILNQATNQAAAYDPNRSPESAGSDGRLGRSRAAGVSRLTICSAVD